MNDIKCNKSDSNLEFCVNTAIKHDETSKYAELLQQVENLKVENTSLKKELNSNTCHINRLESEATTLKEIVVELKQSISNQKNLKNQTIASTASNLNFNYGQFLSVSMDAENVSFSSTNKTLNSLVFNSSIIDFELDVRKRIMLLQQQRCKILQLLQKDEIAKETYMKKLNDLDCELNAIVKSSQDGLVPTCQSACKIGSSINSGPSQSTPSQSHTWLAPSGSHNAIVCESHSCNTSKTIPMPGQQKPDLNLFASENTFLPMWKKENDLSSRMPTDLAKKLRDTFDDYIEEDDNPINYSLQYTESELGSSFVVGNIPSATKTCTLPLNVHQQPITSHACDEKQDKKSLHKSYSLRPKIDSSVEQKLVLADKQVHEAADEAPTDFGAMYAEEYLDGDCEKDYSLQPYASEKRENVKNYKEENSREPRASVSQQNNQETKLPQCEKIAPNNDQVGVSKMQLAEAAEEDDKFSGAMTPRHYFSKSNRHSGYMTPKHAFQETPLMMYSPMNGSRSSLDSIDHGSFRSDLSSEFESRLQSGYISPSDLPDSPGQSMPQSRCRSPRSLTNGKTLISQPNSSNNNSKDQCKGSHSNLRGLQLIEKAHVLSPSYLAGIPPCDEMKCFSTEPAMSVMTGLSDLSLEGEKITVLSNLKKKLPTSAKNTNDKLDVSGPKSVRTTKGPGYVTSLPSSDEIKNYCFEGTLSPFAGLSEISVLHSHNEGFQKNSFPGQEKARKLSNRNSYTSRSSATGASAPLPPVSNQDEDEACDVGKAPPISSRCTSAIEPEHPTSEKEEGGCDVNDYDEENTDDLKVTSNGFLPSDQLTNQQAPQTSVSASFHAAGYIRSVPSSDEIRIYQLGEGAMSPMTALSEISLLKTLDEDFQKSNPLLISKVVNTANNPEYMEPDDERGMKDRASTPSNRASTPSTDNSKLDKEAIALSNDVADNQTSSDFLDGSSDDDGLLEQLIKSAEPKKKASNRPRSSKPSTSASRKDRSGSHKHSAKSTSKKAAATSSGEHDPPQPRSIKLDTRDRLAAADSRLKGMNIIDYIEHQMDGTPEAARGEGGKPGRHVIRATETLSGSYSVLKRLRTSEQECAKLRNPSAVGDVVGGPIVVGNPLKGPSFVHKPTTFATEGTPIEISRCTSLSDLTIDSDHHIYDFGALKNKLTPDQTEAPVPNGAESGQLPDCANTFTTTVCIEKGMRHMSLGGHVGANDELKGSRHALKIVKDSTPPPLDASPEPQGALSPPDVESSLSSLDSDDESNLLLKDCITSAMPVPRRDFAAIPPKQLLLQNEAFLREHPNALSLLPPPDHVTWPHHEHRDVAVSRSDFIGQSLVPNHGQPSVLGPHKSMGDPDDGGSSGASTGSLLLGGDAKSLMVRTRNRGKTGRASSSSEMGPGMLRHKQTHGRSRDRIKNKSSSPKYGRTRATESSPSPCSRCRLGTSRKLPGSASMGKLETSSGPRRRRKNTTSSYTKPITAPHCNHVHETRKPTRSRSAHASYYSGVTRMYPRVDDAVMLSGVASMAARGEMVHCDGTQQLVPVNFPLAAYPGPVLLKQPAFIQDGPSQAFLQGGLHSIPTTYQLVNALPASNKKKFENSKKKGGLKSRLKKLISPNNESKKNVRTDDNRVEEATRKSGRISTSSMKGNPRSGKSRRDPPGSTPGDSVRSSSLSLSSSSEESGRNPPVGTYQRPHPTRSIYPTVSSITPNHIPKSPAAKARFSIKKKARDTLGPTDSSSVDEGKHLRSCRVVQEVAPFNYSLPRSDDRVGEDNRSQTRTAV